MVAPVTAGLHRRWPLVAAASVLAVFTLFHVVAFGSAVRRYQSALANAEDLGLVVGPARTPRVLPPRVNALVSANAMPAALAEERGNSGALASDVLADITGLAAKHGMDVVLTEPGLIDQKPSSVDIHAHFRLACTYGQFVGFLDELAGGGRLFAVERFSLVSRERGRTELDLWMSRRILKQAAKQK